MLQRHETELMMRLERVVTHGTAEFRLAELKLWYDAQRIGVTVWRDLHDRWKSIESRPEMKLLIAGMGTDNYVLAWGEGLGTNAESWFQDIGCLARRVNAKGQITAMPIPSEDEM